MRAGLQVAVLATIVAAPLAAQAPAPVRLSIGDVLGRADSAAEGIGIAEAGLRGAGARVRQTRSAMLPQLSGAVTYTRTLETQFAALANGSSSDSAPPPAPTGCTRFRPNPGLPLGERLDSLERGLDCTANGSGGIDFSNLPFGRPNQWNLGLEASQLLFDRALPARIRAANAGAERARATLDAERARTVLDAAQAYYDAQLASRLLAIAESTLVQAERTYDETALARRVGTAAEFDLLRASVARDNQKPVVIQRRTQRDQAFLRLRQLLDLAPDTPLELTTPLADTSAVPLPANVRASTDTAVAMRAPVREASASVDAAEGTLDAARGSRWPIVRLSSSYAKITFPDDVFRWERMLTDWTVSVRASVPLFTGGRIKGEVEAARAEADIARLRLRQAREAASREAVSAAQLLDAATASFAASTGTAEQAARAYQIAEVRVREGLSTLTDLADARLQRQQADANRAQAARDLQVARLRVLLLRDLPLGAVTAPGAF